MMLIDTSPVVEEDDTELHAAEELDTERIVFAEKRSAGGVEDSGFLVQEG
jgi:hypothetical protein